jgi:hypothetical protein
MRFARLVGSSLLVLASLSAACGIDSETAMTLANGDEGGGASTGGTAGRGGSTGTAGTSSEGGNTSSGGSSTAGNGGKGATGGSSTAGNGGSSSGGKGGSPAGGNGGSTAAGSSGSSGGGNGGSPAGGNGGATSGGNGGSTTAGTSGSGGAGATAGASGAGNGGTAGSSPGGTGGGGGSGGAGNGGAGAGGAGNGGAGNGGAGAGGAGAGGAGNGGAGAAGNGGAGAGGSPNNCGNNVIDVGEECDGENQQNGFGCDPKTCLLNCNKPGQAFRDPETKVCFFIAAKKDVGGGLTWDQAKARCDELHGRLATFEGGAELRARVATGLAASGFLWSGAHQRYTGGDWCGRADNDWKWDTAPNAPGLAGNDAIWASDEPNDSTNASAACALLNNFENHDEDCGEIRPAEGLSMNDSDCGNSLFALCQRIPK